MWHGSYGSLTVDNICLYAGINKGSFYHFFDGKAALASAAVSGRVCARGSLNRKGARPGNPDPVAARAGDCRGGAMAQCLCRARPWPDRV